MVLVALAACLFPVPATLLSMQGGTDGSFQSLSFLLLAMLALACFNIWRKVRRKTRNQY